MNAPLPTIERGGCKDLELAAGNSRGCQNCLILVLVTFAVVTLARVTSQDSHRAQGRLQRRATDQARAGRIA
jgi:hypothetical protein